MHLLGSNFRSGFMLRITQTDSNTNLIADGGFFIDFTIVISEGFKVFNAANAAFKAGIASYGFFFCRSKVMRISEKHRDIKIAEIGKMVNKNSQNSRNNQNNQNSQISRITGVARVAKIAIIAKI